MHVYGGMLLGIGIGNALVVLIDNTRTTTVTKQGHVPPWHCPRLPIVSIALIASRQWPAILWVPRTGIDTSRDGTAATRIRPTMPLGGFVPVVYGKIAVVADAEYSRHHGRNVDGKHVEGAVHEVVTMTMMPM